MARRLGRAGRRGDDPAVASRSFTPPSRPVERAFERLPPTFAGTPLVGNGIDVDVLRRAGIESVDAFAAVTQGDNRNIMAAQIATYIFHVPRVVTRIYDTIRSDTYQALGIYATSPTVIGASSLYDRLMGEPLEE